MSQHLGKKLVLTTRDHVSNNSEINREGVPAFDAALALSRNLLLPLPNKSSSSAAAALSRNLILAPLLCVSGCHSRTHLHPNREVVHPNGDPEQATVTASRLVVIGL